MTLRERYTRHLTAIGYVQIESRSKKYIAFHHAGLQRYVWVGKAGSVRVGTVNAVTKAYTSKFAKARLERWEQQQGQSNVSNE